MKIENNNIDTKSRLVGAMGKGSYEEAEEELLKLKLLIVFTDSDSPSQQAALLTCINTGKRCFRGGVHINISSDIEFSIPWEKGISFYNTVTELGAIPVNEYNSSDYSFILYFGTSSKEENSLEVVSDSWRGGAIKSQENIFSPEDNSLALGGIMAGSLAVGKAFLFVTNKNKSGVLEDTILSLWNSKEVDNIPQPVTALPKELWLLGLGHLGQAYLWTLSMLPYSNPNEVLFQLQDFDVASLSNWESSVLTEKKLVGNKKTRICSEWIEKRGFTTNIIERKFDGTVKRQDKEPGILLSGLDNVAARLDIDINQFRLVIDCGLGGDVSSFDHIILRVFPNLGKTPNEVWEKQDGPTKASESLSVLYKNAFGCGYDDKGISTSFVGVFASTWAVAELIKAFNKGQQSRVVSCTIRDLNDSLTHVITPFLYDYQIAMEGFATINKAKPQGLIVGLI